MTLNNDFYDLLRRPIITEKATNASENGAVVFEVSMRATKPEIKKAVEAAYDVSVTKVRTINVRPDRNTRYTKAGVQTGKTNAVKKAIVQLAEGDTIDFYSNI